MTPDTSIWWTVPPMVVFGIGNAFVWAPNSATATRNLPVQLAGAGSGIYNATRQVGAVLGSAAIAVLIDARLAAEGLPSFNGEGSSGGALPPEVAQSFSDAMATSVLLPTAAFVLGFIAVLFFEKPVHAGYGGAPARRRHRVEDVDPPETFGRVDEQLRAGRRQTPMDFPAERRFSHASTTRAAMPASAALPQARGS